MQIPFLDLKSQYQSIQNEINQSVLEVLGSTAYSSGPYVKKFEDNFSKYIGVNHAIGVNSGTSALHLALIAAGVNAGDEVITVSHTFIATIWAITYIGATPIFVDINPDTYTIDVTKIEEKITSKTKAIVPVHLYGQSADLDPIIELCKKHKLVLIEDAAQAQGTEYKGRKCGSIGDLACFSFYPGKNLGAYGEAGAITTNNKEYADRLILLRNHSQPEKYIHDELGFNYRMDGIQGAVLDIKLHHLDKWNHRRREIAAFITQNLNHFEGITPPFEPSYSKGNYHLYEVRLESKEKRNSLVAFLNSVGIQNGLHYPIPVHLQQAYKYLGHKIGDLPETEKAADCLLSLPIFAEMTDQMCQYLVDQIKIWCQPNK